VKTERAPALQDSSSSSHLTEIFGEAFRHHQAGRLPEAERLYRQVLAADPRHADSLHLLGVIACDVGRHDVGIGLIHQAIGISPRIASFHFDLATALQDTGRFDQAIGYYRNAVTLDPNYLEALSNLGCLLKDMGRPNEAIAFHRRALAVDPDAPATYNNLGIALQALGQLGEATVSYRKALALRPDYPDALTNLGNALKDQGRIDEAIASYRQALALKPDYSDAQGNLVMLLHYASDFSSADMLAEARRFGATFERSAPARRFSNDPDPRRRLRIGYVSGDFRTHPVSYFLARVLEAHDHADVEVFCYSNSAIADAMTRRLKQAADRWRNIAALPDAEAAAMIRRDEIDILVDLSGHTSKNRLPLFALKPAPVQAAWLGYFGTTGLSAMDYVLADRFVVPEGEESNFTETVLRLPDSYLCFDPPDIDIAFGPSPLVANGAVTFGCFNNRAKISPVAVELWSRVLKRAPNSRLLLKTITLVDDGIRRDLIALFAEQGIDADRLILEGASPMAEYLAAYNRVDIALDPFPFTGGATTAQTLWMGVPVVTLRGDRWVARQGESILNAVGAPELVAGNPDRYVEIAAALAADPARLAAYRSDLRRHMEASPFCDGRRFARNLEAAYRTMWRTWRQRQSPAVYF
jgi:predicted O-linked N-acetylglucosamine transferase (SPINDLY family)